MKEIVIDVGISQTRIALLENKELTELYIEKHDSERITGNIYKGKVINVLPGMQSAFIDIGLDKNVFLYVKDALPNTYFDEDDEYANIEQYKTVQISDLLKVGQEIMVQVIKEPIDTKGARVTTHITMPGRYLVLMPTVEYIGVSRRIENEQERERLRKLAEEVKPKGMGLIVRTAAEDCTAEDFAADVSFLTKLWESIRQKQKTGEIPRVVHKDLSIVHRTVRDMFTRDIDKFIINSREQYEKVIELLDVISPQLRHRVEYYSKNNNIYESYQLEAKINKLLSRKVWLRCGGYIVIDQTEALTSIDVNTGKFVGTKDLRDTVLKTNMEAAVEIAKQLRLRDIGGIIIIDFIDMPDKEHEKSVIDALKNALKRDRTKTNVLGMTQLGLLEMTRKKVRQRISSVLLSACPYCRGEGKILSGAAIAEKVMKELLYAFVQSDIRALYAEVHPDIVEVLKSMENDKIRILREEQKIEIIVEGNPILHREEYNVKAMGIEEYIQYRKMRDKN